MNQTRLFARIATKAGIHPPIRLSQMMAGEIPFPDHCLIWTGAIKAGGLERKGIDIVMVKPRAKILGNQYLPRYLLEILHGPQKRFFCTCKNTLCVNPAHWTYAEVYVAPSTLMITPTEQPWTYEEAEELVEMYLRNNRRPLDPTHALLQDIPPELLKRFQTR